MEIKIDNENVGRLVKACKDMSLAGEIIKKAANKLINSKDSVVYIQEKRIKYEFRLISKSNKKIHLKFVKIKS